MRSLVQLFALCLACAPLTLLACHHDDSSAPPSPGGDDGGPDAAAPDGGTHASAGHPPCRSGWCWSNPSPQGSALTALWVFGPNDVWGGADRGTLLHFDGSTWMELDVGGPDPITALYGFAPNDLWAATMTALFHWDGASWTPGAALFPRDPERRPPATIATLWGPKPGEIYAGGSAQSMVAPYAYDDVLFHGDGLTMQPVKLPTTSGTIVTMWGTGANDVWCGGGSGSDGQDAATRGQILHYDGATWTRIDSIPVKAIAGRSANDVYAFGGVGDAQSPGGGAQAVHFDGHAWTPLAVPTGAVIFRDAWSTIDGDVWTLTADGKLLTVEGGAFTPVPLGDVAGALAAAVPSTGAIVRGVHGDLWITSGGNGSLFEQRGTQWSMRSSSVTSETLTAIATTRASDVWAVGTRGTIVRGDGATWKLVPSGVTADLTGVWGASPDDVWAVGSAGTIVHVVAGGAQTVKGPSGEALTAVWGSRADDVWAVGAKGTVLHYDGSAWSASVVPNGAAFDYGALWGSGADDVWAATNEGFSGSPFAHWDGHAWTVAPRTGVPDGGDPSSGAVTALSGTGPSDLWALVAVPSTRAYHFDGHAWSAAQLPHDYLRAVSAIAPNDVWAVGDYGLAHYDGASWKGLESPAQSLDAIGGSPGGDAFAVGPSGVILRHAR